MYELESNAQGLDENNKIDYIKIDLSEDDLTTNKIILCDRCNSSPKKGYILMFNGNRTLCSDCIVDITMMLRYESKKKRSKKNNRRDEK